MRTVTAVGWPYQYRAYVVPAPWFGKPRWRYIVEQKWVGWRYHRASRRFKTERAAIAAANRWLDRIDDKHDKKDYV